MDFSTLLSAVGDNVFILLAFIIALSVIVAIHEYGHYIVGRWSGIYAEVFSIGFGPVVWSRRDKRGTVWQIAALPFGGYVKFLGDANAASVGGTAQVEGFTERQTMLGAPLWARSATVVAGPVFNFILAVLIFTGFFMWNGKVSEQLVLVDSFDLPAQLVNELEAGDRIVAVEDIVFGEEGTNVDDLPKQPSYDYRVMRDGDEIIVQGPHPIVPRVDRLSPRSAADDAKLKVGDVIVSVDGAPIYAFNGLVDAVQAAQGAPLSLTAWRDGELMDFTLTPRETAERQEDGSFENNYRIGIAGTFFFTPATDRIGPWEAFKYGSEQLWVSISGSLVGLWQVITGGISTCNISGPVAIAQASGSMASQGAEDYVLFIGMLSAAVGLLNLFPIPVLDGGHLVFHAYEAITRRKPGERAVQFLMLAGVSLVGALMVFALLNDLVLCP